MLKIQLCYHINKLHFKILYIQIENNYPTLKCDTISQYYCFYCIFDQITTALENMKLFFKNIQNWPKTCADVYFNLHNFKNWEHVTLWLTSNQSIIIIFFK